MQDGIYSDPKEKEKVSTRWPDFRSYEIEDGVVFEIIGHGFADGDTITCPYGESNFTLPSGSIVFGRAGLANLSSSDSSSGSSSNSSSALSSDSGSCNQTAVGAGVGIPLGVIAVSAVLWALWERRRKKRITALLQDRPQYVPAVQAPALAELDDQVVSEMMDTSQRTAAKK
ncbi:hypothetical protein T310_2793 [Rasamsonia emersonii CBS 393.64]|uniref:Uncharacterized protein n=1 Tax=Rasamsonia emersonii (strain ATCC 16479 / CBS 393.64 / IMI 116815) TaxID=1408163 RepID=A0A0F4YZB8_RASE3|nr:hypothetical protein T310_2793 [Rasamsonia emersonii CBS 393.64]KKA23161.1 hypothetical protein T310_2793 [Rasamsonia emersonii CBS 393.64]